MKDRLEEFIRDNRSSFDIWEPGEMLWEGIRTNRRLKSRSNRSVKIIILRIAAVLLVFMASWAAHDYIDYRHRMAAAENESRIYRLIPELKETETYYDNLVSMKMNELRPYFTKMPALGNEVHGDISELDSVYVSLKKDLSDNIANNEVIEAMIQNYRMKLEILEDLLSELKKEQNPAQNEKKGSDI